jgi:2'-hydroxyisoflavone reductase
MRDVTRPRRYAVPRSPRGRGRVGSRIPRDDVHSRAAMLAPSARLTWVSDEFLLNRGVVPWTELPLWIPWTAGPLLRLDDRKAREMGLRHRSVQDTIVDVLNDRAAHDDALVGGLRKAQPLSNAREAALLAEWRTSAG